MKQNARPLRAVVHNVARRPAVINGSRGFLPPRMAREDARQCFAARILCGAGYAVTSPGCRRAPLRPSDNRGDGASPDASIQSALGEARACLTRRARPAGAPSRRFQSPGPCFRAREGPECSPPLIRAASSHSRQRPIVRADGHPRSPGSGVTRHFSCNLRNQLRQAATVNPLTALRKMPLLRCSGSRIDAPKRGILHLARYD